MNATSFRNSLLISAALIVPEPTILLLTLFVLAGLPRLGLRAAATAPRTDTHPPLGRNTAAEPRERIPVAAFLRKA